MASLELRLPTNVPGPFFVDSSCIDCDACRQIAPSTFAEAGDQSAVVNQPETPEDELAAQKALISCPTASIGRSPKNDMREALAGYPDRITGNVYFCGYTSENSFGALSYLVVRPEGNLLVDSPRFAGPLVKRITEVGGVSKMLLTHRDDVADHAKFRERFSCERVLHHSDVTSSTSSMERQPRGLDPVRIDGRQS